MTNRPLGPIVAHWQPAAAPDGVSLSGRYATLTPLDLKADAPGLWETMKNAPWLWDYLYEEAPADFAAFQNSIAHLEGSRDHPCLVIRVRDAPTPLGYACFWTNAPATGTTEIGNVNLSPALQRTPAATEAFFLMIDWAFAHGYRRVEWKCNALNRPSRRAAQRLGFSYEGVFRQHLVVKGRNRDTAWFAMTDADWRQMRPAYDRWLDPDNFDGAGQQRTSLGDLTRPHLFQADPTL
ncbi:Protein N-acetyltransferase, RimJ/RimL family [Cognatiyoonia koreensis]|uniref:Protein N-acetyltransferase, RimJ/RimL family n=1 Tax=Cognatiyoonia koreensis TaxID=364200 RepID=A0A1I0N2N8_9RHOB|nr:GNAT family protein [Cognatiyoonia koreensis]SEV95312.1 Protein N-acetyltransferase, RimJ/RimL family [Cognatiyoonia koreensis]